MNAEIAGTPPFLLSNFDDEEVMASAEPHHKVVAACDETVFRRKVSKRPHVTMSMCVSPYGDGPPPLFIFPGMTQVTQFAEQVDRIRFPGKFHRRSSVMTSQAFLPALEEWSNRASRMNLNMSNR
jgi:hypothetical protein